MHGQNHIKVTACLNVFGMTAVRDQPGAEIVVFHSLMAVVSSVRPNITDRQ